MKLELRKLDRQTVAAIASAELPIGLSLDTLDLSRGLVVEPFPGRPWTVLFPTLAVSKTGLNTSFFTREAANALVTYIDDANRTRTLLLEIHPSRKGETSGFELLRSSGSIVAHGRITSLPDGELEFEATPPQAPAKRDRRPAVLGKINRDGVFELKFVSNR